MPIRFGLNGTVGTVRVKVASLPARRCPPNGLRRQNIKLVMTDTDNQLRKPHRLGKGTLPGGLMVVFMWALIVGEIGGFLVLFYGVILGL